MLSLYGPNYLVKNIYLLSKNSIHDRIYDISSLKIPFLEFLKKHQPNHPINKDKNIFITDKIISDRLKISYQPSELNDLNQNNIIGDILSLEEMNILITKLKEAINILKDINPILKIIFDIVIHSIFFRKSNNGGNIFSFGGSSSTAIGTIWISGHGDIKTCDILEFLVHELTHHLLFIDERCHAQFYYGEMHKKHNFSRSALLGKKRPLDKVVHSIVVSTEILIARRTFLPNIDVKIHPPTKILYENTIDSIEEIFLLENLETIVTHHTINILKNCKKSLEDLKLKEVV